jgi:hypothetical protein
VVGAAHLSGRKCDAKGGSKLWPPGLLLLVEREGVGSRPTRQRRRPTSWWSGSSSGERSGACMSTIPGSLTGGAVDGLNQPGHYSSWVGPNPFKPTIFYEFKLAQICKLQNLVFHCRKNTQTFHEARLEYSKQLSQLGQLHILNTIYAIISLTGCNLKLL